jgi:hypothetical protein
MEFPHVVNSLSEFKDKVVLQPQSSLLDKIENAQSVKELNDLLKVGASYTGAKPKTLKMWAKAAARRISVLSFK